MTSYILGGRLGLDVVRGATLLELFLVRLYLLGDLLAYGLPQGIRICLAEVCKVGGDLHDLFLVDDDAVRLLQDLFQKLRLVPDEARIVLPLDEVIDHPAPEGARAGRGR